MASLRVRCCSSLGSLAAQQPASVLGKRSASSGVVLTRFLSSASTTTHHTYRRTTASALRPAVSSSSPTPPLTQTRRMASAAPAWKAPADKDLDTRPVLIVGAGNLGSRMAVMWASASRPVVIYDSSKAALDAAVPWVSDTLAKVCADEERHPGHVSFVADISKATAAAPWMAIEALPEKLDLKRAVLGKLEPLLPDDCIIATNSSSYRSQEMVGAGAVTKPVRFLNTHYYVPPRNRYVELMSSGSTDNAVFPFLVQQMKRVALKPIVLPSHVQSPGFVFNRIWAATKRETLAVLAEDIARPGDIDALFRDFFHAEKGPCEKMDEVGLDAVHRVESHSLQSQPELGSESQLAWLKKEYLDKNQLGEKTGDGLFTAKEREILGLRETKKDDSLGA